ncbi:MAG: hypothetical protein AAGF54_10370 [Pseudomonadota bacterium]
MDRRNFLKSIGAASLLPVIPMPAISAASPAAAIATAPVFTSHTYQWAEMIVRAHNKCNLGLLQRSLQVDVTVAEALKKELIKNGIVAAKANAYGLHKATKPLYEGSFLKPSEPLETAKDIIEDFITPDDELDQAGLDEEKDNDHNDMELDSESISEETEESLEPELSEQEPTEKDQIS